MGVDILQLHFTWILQFGGSTSVIFLKIKRVKHLSISVSAIIRCSENLHNEIRTCKKEQYIKEVLQTR